jgi:hypothetical protein
VKAAHRTRYSSDVDPEPTEEERARVRGEVARVRRSLFIIFGFGVIATALVIVYVMRHLPEGNLNSEVVAAPVPGAPPEPERCKRFGDSCVFEPGKLGTCVQRENCTGANCLFCQSQH